MQLFLGCAGTKLNLKTDGNKARLQQSEASRRNAEVSHSELHVGSFSPSTAALPKSPKSPPEEETRTQLHNLSRSLTFPADFQSKTPGKGT